MNALAIRDDINLEQLQTLGQVFVQSKFFTDTTQAAQAIVKVMAGRELGFQPIASMTGVYIVKGKITLSANLMAAAIKRSVKYNYRIKELTSQAAELEFFEDGVSVGPSRYTMIEAKSAGLADSPTWQKYPRNMLFARAMSNGAKWYCPDIFGGGPIYTPEELGATVNEEGDVIDLPVEVEPEPTPDGEPEPVQPPTEAQWNHVEAMAELRSLARELNYTDKALVKWVSKKYNLDEGLKINDALLSLGQGELQAAIEIFERHIEAARFDIGKEAA